MNGSSGTFTFLFTDIEDSASLWESEPTAMRTALARHDLLLRDIIGRFNGKVFKTVGDAFRATFATPQEALAAAIAAQQTLIAEHWQEQFGLEIRIRMGLHIGVAECRDDDFFGPSLNRVARVSDLGHGGQILLTQAAYQVMRDSVGPEIGFRSLEAWRLKGMTRPETVFQVLAPGLPIEFPSLRAVSSANGNLPEILSSFVGREAEIERIGQRLERLKLVTLRGAGGCGKTRLAIEASRPLTVDFPGGVWLIRLDALTESDLIARETARALRLYVPPGETPEEALANRLRNESALLILDNCEHLRVGCARFVHELLTVCPGMRILATSREPLGVPGEQIQEVTPLRLPKSGGRASLNALRSSEAVQLFVARAEAASNFALTTSNAPIVADICRTLDGIPLALELAARWVGVLPLEEIAKDLSELVNDPQDADDTGLIPTRQQTMKAAVDWTFQRLSPGEQSLFLNIAVFVGGFTLDAARSVGVDSSETSTRTVRLLKGLVDRSLVFLDEQAKPEPRYRLLEPIREVALEKLMQLPEWQSACDRHRDWFLTYAERCEPELKGTEQALWLDKIEADHDNFRAALKYSVQPDLRVRLATALHRFWQVRGHLAEGRMWLEGCLDRVSDPAIRGKGLNAAGVLAYVQNEFDDARLLFVNSLNIYRTLGDFKGTATSLNNLGITEERLSLYPEAKQRFEECLNLYRQLNDSVRSASVMSNLGMVAYHLQDFDTAAAWLDESIDQHKANENALDLGTALHNLGVVLFEKADYTKAMEQHLDSLKVRNDIKHEQGVIASLYRIGLTWSLLGNLNGAVVAYALAEALLLIALSSPVSEDDRTDYLNHIALLRTKMSMSEFDEHWIKGQNSTVASLIIEFRQQLIAGPVDQ